MGFGPPRLVADGAIVALGAGDRAEHEGSTIAIHRGREVERIEDRGFRIDTDLVRCAWPHGLALSADPSGRSGGRRTTVQR